MWGKRKEDWSEGKMYVGHLGFIILFWATFVTSEIFHNKKFIKETMKC